LRARPYGLVILLVGSLVMMGAGGFARYGFTLLLPDMREGLGATYGQMGVLATANNLGYVLSSLLGGIAAARFGARRVISSSMFAAGAATFATGLAPSFEFALAAQLLTGLVAGGCIVPVLGLVSAWFSPARRGLAAGVMVGGLPLGILLSALFIPLILSTYGPAGWRYSWHALGAVVFLLGLAALALVRDRAEDETVDIEGAPALRWGRVYRSPAVWLLSIINGSVGLAGGVFAFFFVAYLVSDRGLSSNQAAGIWGTVGLAGIFSGLFWGTISDIVGRKRGLVADYSMFFIALVLLTFVPRMDSYYLSAVLGGLALYGGLAISVALCGDLVGPRLAPAAFGFISVSFNLSQVISPAMTGFLKDATGSFTVALIVAVFISFLGTMLCLRLPSHGSVGPPSPLPESSS
jgi:MFS family permease